MKKFFLIVLIFISFICLFILSGCDEGTAFGHEHTYSSEWSFNEDYHWHKATCEHINEVKDLQRHTWNNGICSICNYFKFTTDLEYTLSDDSKYYIVTGLGTSQDLDIIIPDKYNELPVTQISNSAFKNSYITSISIPDTVITIEDESFYGCNYIKKIEFRGNSKLDRINKKTFQDCTSLENIVIPKSVEEIDEFAFYNCNNLISITIPNSVITIGNSAFYECYRLKNVNFDEDSNLININDYAFYHCSNLNNIILPNTINSIGKLSFSRCVSLDTINFPNNLKYIGANAFYGCNSLTSAILPNSLNSVGRYAFAYCDSLTIAYIPGSLMNISEGMFIECTNLKTVYIFNGVTKIEKDAFYFCSNLTDILIPENLSSIGYFSFTGCKNLNSVYFWGQQSNWDTISFDTGNNEITKANRYYYSETNPYIGDNPITQERYWYFDFNNNEINIWEQ